MKLRAWIRGQTVAILSLAIVASYSEDTQEGSNREAEQLNTQVAQLYRQGRYNVAVPLAQRALTIDEKTLGPEHPGTALTLNNLAELYRTTGAYAPCFGAAVRTTRILGACARDTLDMGPSPQHKIEET